MNSFFTRVVRRVRLLGKRFRYEITRPTLGPAAVAARRREESRGRQLLAQFLAEAPSAFRDLNAAAAIPEERMAELRTGRFRDQHGVHDIAGVNWHREPMTGEVWPRRFVGALSDYRPPSDLVLLWHLNKMMFLHDFAHAFVRTGDVDYARRWIEAVDSWCRQNPLLVGMNWRSPMEMGTRLVVWSVGLAEIASANGAWSQQQMGRIIGSLIQQAEFVATHFSRREIPNNHLIGEAATLYVFAAFWPALVKSEEWKQMSERVLVEEASRQILPDGVQYENAFNYHAYVLDFYLLYLNTQAATGRQPRAEVVAAAEKLARTILRCISPYGRLPRFGDDSLSEFIVLKSLADLERIRFGDHLRFDQLLKAEFAGSLRRTEWGRELMALTTPLECAYHLSSSGFSVFRGRRSHLVWSSGPEHDRPFSSGHLHSDAASFELEIGGQPVVVDSGTYLYGSDPAVRNHFKSAWAHNGLLVNGHDPMVSRGVFQWEQVPRGRTMGFSSAGRVKYTSCRRELDDGDRAFVHDRILVQYADAAWVVVDRVVGDGETAADQVTALLHTPFGPEAITGSGELRVRWPDGGCTLRARASSACEVRVISDKTDARTWYSPYYGERRYGTVVQTTAPVRGRLCLCHVLNTDDAEVDSISIDEHSVRLQISTGPNGTRDLLIETDPLRVLLDGADVA